MAIHGRLKPCCPLRIESSNLFRVTMFRQVDKYLMKHVKQFGEFLNERELTDEELESQTEPTHVVYEPTDFKTLGGDGGFDLEKFDTVYIDEEGDRMLVIDGNNPGMILDFIPGFVISDHFLKIDSPKGKEFLHQNRGQLQGKKFGF